DKRKAKFVYQGRTEGVHVRYLGAIPFGRIVLATYWANRAGVYVCLVRVVVHVNRNVDAVLIADVVVQTPKRFLAITVSASQKAIVVLDATQVRFNIILLNVHSYRIEIGCRE